MKYKNIFAKGYTLNWCEEVFMIKKVKNIVPLTYVISDLICKEIFERFCKKELQKTNQKVFRVETEERKSREKMINYILNGKVMIVLLTVGQIKKTKYKWVNVFLNKSLWGETWKLN